MNPPIMALSCLLMSTLILFLPLFKPRSSNFVLNTKTSVKTSFFISSASALLMINNHLLSSSFSISWLNTSHSDLKCSITIDQYSTLFLPIALLVTWSIVEYSLWYMKEDPKIQLFFKYLLIFLLAMTLLISAGNLVTLFIGWEGVGIMSYLLIGWYFTRSNAGTAALQAVLYNRIGDLGFLFSLLWLFSSYSTTELNFIFSMNTPNSITVALIIAAASKSAQFSLHPWLTSAMEGPTPVSALLHSSTMVVAGVFLLIRTYPLIMNNPMALSTCLSLGAISTTFAATSAIMQNDIKKIIAFSTSSQLGLMIISIGLGMPHLAFFHICTHAFFKAMLFLCSGSIIHNLNNEQDLRKMGGLQKILPITTSCMTIGSLSLMGTPYMSGFFSKDAIIEAMSTSNINACALVMAILATSLTAAYSLRIIFFISMQHPRSNPTQIMNELHSTLMRPLKRLALGSVIMGLILNQVILPSSPMTTTMPEHLKTLAILASILGFIVALDLTPMLPTSPHQPQLKLFDTSFFQCTIHRLMPSLTLNLNLKTASNLIDTLWLEKVGPKGLSELQISPIKKNQELQKGLIKMYLSIFIFSSILSAAILKLV